MHLHRDFASVSLSASLSVGQWWPWLPIAHRKCPTAGPAKSATRVITIELNGDLSSPPTAPTSGLPVIRLLVGFCGGTCGGLPKVTATASLPSCLLVGQCWYTFRKPTTGPRLLCTFHFRGLNLNYLL